MNVRAITAQLDALGVEYALIGAFAMAAHGIVRATHDLDLLTVEPRVLDAALWASFVDQGVQVTVHVGDLFDPLRGTVRMRSADGEQIDLVVGKYLWQKAIIERSDPLPFEGVTLRIPSRADLILLKLHAGGPQDLHDVLRLLRIADASLTITDVEHRIGDLPSDARKTWRQVLDSTSSSG